MHPPSRLATISGYATDLWPFVGMLALLVAAGAVAWAVALLWTQHLVHRPPRLTPARALVRLGRSSPDDLGLAFEDETFEVGGDNRPAALLRAWWIPAQSAIGSCVLLHGYGESRSAALAWAPVWHGLGWNLLIPDLRAHGESGGRASGAGVWESLDIDELLNDLLARRSKETETLVLTGLSFGAMVAADVASKRDDLSAVVLDSPIADWMEAVERWGDLLALPPRNARGLRQRLTAWHLGTKPPTEMTAKAVAKIGAPVLLILPQWDALIEPRSADRLVDAVGSEAVWRPETTHNRAWFDEPEEYRRRIQEITSAGARPQNVLAGTTPPN